MAKTNVKKTEVTLGNIIESQNTSFIQARNNIRNIQETEFLNRVIDDGLSYSDQIDYYKSELQKEKDRRVPDQSYISQIKKQISDLGKLNRAQKFNDAYRESVSAVSEQVKSIDNHITFLKNQLENAVDIDLKNTIKDKIVEAENAKFTMVTNTVVEKANYAIKDKSLDLLNKSIDQVKSRRNLAAGSNNTEEVAKWDTLLLNLKSQVQSTKIQNSFNDLAIDNMQKPVESTDLLNFFTTNLRNSTNERVPLVIDGVKYNSAQDFWQAKTNDYVQNTFFKAYQQEKQEELLSNSKKLTPVLEANLRQINSEISDLSSNPLLRPYADQFDQMKININFDGVTKVGEKTLDDYNNGRYSNNTIENFNIARQKLNNLNQLYNVDVNQYLTQITEDIAAKKTAAAETIVSEAQARGISEEEAAKEVKVTDIPTGKVAEKSTVELAKEISPSTPVAPESDISGSTGTIDQGPKTEVSKPESQTQEAPKVNEPEQMAAPTTNTITIQSGDTLSKLAKKYNTDINRLLELNPTIKDPNLIYSGAKLNIPMVEENNQ